MAQEIAAGGHQPSYNEYKADIYNDLERMHRTMKESTFNIEERLGELHGDMSKSRMGVDFDAVSEASSYAEASQYDDRETRKMMRKYNKIASEASKYLNSTNLAKLGEKKGL